MKNQNDYKIDVYDCSLKLVSLVLFEIFSIKKPNI